MRGTPFLKESWTGGLNTIDSPYTLAENESRSLLNVVSTERGAIRKRYGSSLFTPEAGGESGFPTLVVKDSFKRAEEKPLSNGGKWSTITGAADTGEIRTEEAWEADETKPESGARWNAAEQANPAVSLEVQKVSANKSRQIGVWACLSATEKSGYLVRWNYNLLKKPVTIEKWVKGTQTILATALTEGKLVAKDLIGISVRAGKVAAWHKTSAGEWEQIAIVADTTFTTGYTGIMGVDTTKAPEASVPGQYVNFAFGEMVAATNLPNVEFDSLFSCSISGTNFMLASGGGNIYSITTSGVVNKIGEGFTTGQRWSFVQAPVSTGIASQGPVYMVNGVDKPQYWTGAEAKTKVKEWTGIASAPEAKDGKGEAHSTIFKSTEAGFISSDVGLTIQFKSTVEIGEAKTVIKEALIETVINSKEVKLAINEEGFSAEVKEVKFIIERAFYEKGKHVPNGQYMTFFGNRIWMTGIKEDPSAVWFSELVSIGEGGSQADPSSWPNTNVVRFDASDGHEISGISPVGPYLAIFKSYKTWIVHDVNSGANRRLSDSVGCIANRSLVETQGGLFFLTADQGVYLTEGSKLHEMSYNVKPTILNINPAQRQNAAGAYFNNHYYLSFAFGTSNVANRTLDYDVQLKTWWLHDLTGNQWTPFEAVSGQPYLYAIPPGTKKGVVRAFVEGLYEDSGAVYPGENGLSAFWLSAWEPFSYYIFRHRVKAPFLKKRVRAIHFDGEGSINPLVFKNFGATGLESPGVVGKEEQSKPTLPVNFSQGETIYGNEDETQLFGGETYKGVEMIFGGSAQVQDARVYAPGVGRVWSVGFGNKTNEGFLVDSATYFISFRKS